MTAAVPASRPRLTRAQMDALLLRSVGSGFLAAHPLIIVGVRGYYRDTLGKPGANDRGIYDDAVFIVAPEAFVAYNANVDPSGYRKGSGIGARKGMASLKSGLWQAHRFGLHRGKYMALIQTGGEVTVSRDGDPPYEDTGYFGINIHKGSVGSTSSEGCQTIPAGQWDGFIATAMDQAKRLFGASWAKTTIPYLLVEGPL